MVTDRLKVTIFVGENAPILLKFKQALVISIGVGVAGLNYGPNRVLSRQVHPDPTVALAGWLAGATDKTADDEWERSTIMELFFCIAERKWRAH